MKFPPETLMAYADGELDAQTRRAIEAEMAVDPQVAQEVERHRAMRAEVGGAFAGVLDEPVPDRLLRAAKKSPANTSAQPRRRWSWPEWTSIAASLLIGILAGRAMLQPESESGLVVAGSDGRVIAGGALAQALSEQLSSQDGTDIDIGLTFRTKVRRVLPHLRRARPEPGGRLRLPRCRDLAHRHAFDGTSCAGRRRL